MSLRLKFGKSMASRRSFKSMTGQKPDSNPKSMGLPRVISTLIVLAFAAVTTYVTFLYLLPFVNPKQILGVTQPHQIAKSEETNRTAWLYETLTKPFEGRRSYLRPRQGIRAHYDIPAGTTADIVIEHCMRAIIVEAFKCKVVGSSTASIGTGVGTRKFTFSKAGFYQFRDQLRYTASGEIVPQSKQQDYRIIWARY